MTKFNYFYKTENLINGNFYYGVHKSSNLNDEYMGSGKRIRYALEKYGKENFKKEILLFFNTYEEALNYESEIVNEQLLMDPSCYNIAHGGKSDTGFLRQGPPLINKKTEELIKPKNIEEYNKLFKSGDYYGNAKGKGIYKSENGKIFHLNVNDEKIKELNLHGLCYNMLLCQNKEGCIFWVNKNDERYLKGELTLFWKNKKFSKEHKENMKITYKKNKHQQGEKNSQFGTRWFWIYNENLQINKKIKRELIEEYELNGWKKGRKIKF